MTKDKTKWAYLAGIVDGEGCISISSYLRNVTDRRNGTERKTVWMKNHLQFDVAGTNEAPMKFMVENFGGAYYKTDLGNSKWKNRFNWRAQNQSHLKKILLGILPYLVLKREQAILALTYIEKRERGEHEGYDYLALRCKQLNAKGPSLETNTLDTEQSVKIESDLIGNYESALPVMANA